MQVLRRSSDEWSILAPQRHRIYEDTKRADCARWTDGGHWMTNAAQARFLLHWRDGGVHAEFFGHVGDDVLWKADDAVHHDPLVTTLRHVIIDMSHVQSVTASETIAIEQAAVDLGTSRYIPPLRIALVGTLPEARELMLEYKHQGERIGVPWTFELFDALPEARAWVLAEVSAP